jgi:L-ascorbate metabolism protein UlaG (beta-lactamase superfamily)
MLDIEYKGANAIVISSKKTQVVIDPKLSLFGLKDVSVKDAVELATESRFLLNNKSAKIAIEGPGEYEIGDVSITGVRALRHIDGESDEPVSTMYRIEIGDIRMAVLGNIAPRLDEQQLEDLGIVDMVILPIGGNGYTLDATSAASLVRQIDPKVVVPVHYADEAVKYEVPQDKLEVFTAELAAPVEQVGAKYKIKSSAAIPQVLTIVTVDRS